MAGKANVISVEKEAFRVLFSFLVPVYNTEKYLEKCVESLLVQKGADFEIILLDDGSPDGSPKLCDNLQAAYPGIIRVIHKENEGSFFTRRRGFREARGDWFFCIDSDDYVAPHLLETVAAAIEANEGCDMVMFNHCYVDNAGVTSPSKFSLPEDIVYTGKNKQLLYAARLTTTGANSMCLRAVHRNIVDIDADYSGFGIRNMCDDALQVLPLYTNTKKTIYVDQPLYYYRKGNVSITSRTTLANWQAIHRSFVLEQTYAEKWVIPEEVSHKRYTRQMENICNCVRWLYRNMDEKKVPDMILTMMEESMFRQCLAHYDTKYAVSRYSAISMPIISRAMERRWFGFLKFFFGLEQRLRGR